MKQLIAGKEFKKWLHKSKHSNPSWTQAAQCGNKTALRVSLHIQRAAPMDSAKQTKIHRTADTELSWKNDALRSQTHSKVRERIGSYKQLVKSTVASCTVCKEFKANAGQQNTAPVPKDWITQSPTYKFTDVDFSESLYTVWRQNILWKVFTYTQVLIKSINAFMREETGVTTSSLFLYFTFPLFRQSSFLVLLAMAVVGLIPMKYLKSQIHFMEKVHSQLLFNRSHLLSNKWWFYFKHEVTFEWIQACSRPAPGTQGWSCSNWRTWMPFQLQSLVVEQRRPGAQCSVSTELQWEHHLNTIRH